MKAKYFKSGDDVSHHREEIGPLPGESDEPRKTVAQTVAEMKEEVSRRLGTPDEQVRSLQRRIELMKLATSSMEKRFANLKKRK